MYYFHMCLLPIAHIIPQRRVPRTSSRGPIVRVAIITLTYSPKERFLKEPHRGVPLVEWLSLPYIIPQGRVL